MYATDQQTSPIEIEQLCDSCDALFAVTEAEYIETLGCGSDTYCEECR